MLPTAYRIACDVLFAAVAHRMKSVFATRPLTEALENS